MDASKFNVRVPECPEASDNIQAQIRQSVGDSIHLLGQTKVCEGANGIRPDPIDGEFSQMAVPHSARERAFAYWLGRYQRLLGYVQPSFDFERSNEKCRAWWSGYQDGEKGAPIPDDYRR